MNVAYNMDCVEAMRQMPDKAFELAITDPPYFEKVGKEIFPGAEISTTGVRRKRFKSKHWDMPTQKYFDELVRISKNQIVWGINYFDCSYLGSGRIVWDKQNDKSSFSKCEVAFCSLHNSVQMFRYLWNGMLQGNMMDKEIRIHPTQKPVALYEWILTNYAKPGDKILDTHLGSGSSRIAAYNLGFDFTGYEIDADYFKAQEERFAAHTAQINLFTEAT